MKIKIVENGWAGYNGSLRGVPFKEGVSVREVTPREARMIGSSLRVENLSGDQVGAAQDLLSLQNISALVVAPMAEGTIAPVKQEMATEVAPNEPQAPATPAVSQAYTLEQLAEIADKAGIDGLREVADRMNVRGRGIRELIEKILEVQKERGIR